MNSTLLPVVLPQNELLAEHLETAGVRDPEGASTRLLHEFGSIRRVLGASWWALRRIVGIRAATRLREQDVQARESLLRKVEAQPRLQDRAAIQRFLQENRRLFAEHSSVAMFVDADLRLIQLFDAGAEFIEIGRLDVAPLLRRGASLGAAGFFLVHHVRVGETEQLGPSGRFEPVRSWTDGAELPLICQIAVEPGSIAFFDGVLRPSAHPSASRQAFPTA